MVCAQLKGVKDICALCIFYSVAADNRMMNVPFLLLSFLFVVYVMWSFSFIHYPNNQIE